MNKVLVITSGEDDLGKTEHALSKVNGNSGSAVACCEIKPLSNEALVQHGRCEKPSPTEARPKCADASDCCGAARAVGSSTLTQIEVCFNENQKEYEFVPYPGAAPIQYQFICLESGMKLMASTLFSAVSIAMTML